MSVLIFAQILGQLFFDCNRQTVRALSQSRIPFEDAEQDHGQDLIHGLFHKDGRFDCGQSALDAMPFDCDLGRQVFKLALFGAF